MFQQKNSKIKLQQKTFSLDLCLLNRDFYFNDDFSDLQFSVSSSLIPGLTGNIYYVLFWLRQKSYKSV